MAQAAQWRHAETTDKPKKLHASLTDWSKLSAVDRDRVAARAIVDVLCRAEYRALHAKK